MALVKVIIGREYRVVGEPRLREIQEKILLKKDLEVDDLALIDGIISDFIYRNFLKSEKEK